MRISDYFRSISIIYFSLAAIMTAFAVFVYFAGDIHTVDPSNSELFRYGLIVLVPAGWGIQHAVAKSMVSRLAGKLKEKLIAFQGIQLIRAAFLEAPGLLAGVGAFVTGDNSLLLFVVPELIAFVVLRPTPQSIVRILSLDDNDRMTVEDPEAELK